ncbi:Neuroblastoma-amplified sequence, partial [Heterocephalus glaber]
MAAPESSPALSPGIAEGEEETILYDLLVNTEWPPEIEVQPRGNRKQGASCIITKAIRDHLLFLRQYIWYSPAPFLLPDGLVRLVNKQINWHLVLASNGKLLAAVQDQCVEIRSAKDDFTSIIGKCQVPKDPKPQWRRVAWSYDCTLLAYAESTGTVRVFDLMGSELFVIAPASSFVGDLSCAIAGLIFLEYKASAQWSAELLVTNYRGELRSYLVSVGTNQSYQESHRFNFSSHYPHGINTAVYHPAHRLLLVGGCGDSEVGVSRAASCGLFVWRVLSGSPYYKQVTSGGDSVTEAPKTLGLLRMLSTKLYSHQGQEQDGIFKMSLSPDGNLLAAIHFSGKLSVWAVPSLRQLRVWEQSEQPGYDDLNPDWRLSAEKRKKIKDKESLYPLIDVNWWADGAVTLARCSGALTIFSVKTLKNLLGRSCEWFEPSPQVTATHDGGFLSLECEVKLVPKRSRLELRAGDEDDGEEDSDSDHEASAKARYFGYIKQGLYLVTEMERFAPPRKRPRTIMKNYRLVSLRSTTPEELYQRKIESEEYEEALSLAHTYGLDTDLVYQRQWRKSAVNIASIQNYLVTKIKKRSWVLHECLERVPENVEAAKELLQYGLKGTDLEALLALQRGVHTSRFTLPGDVDIDGVPYEELSAPLEELTRRQKEKALGRRHELLKLVNFSELTLEQKELCRCRLKLLTYLDRLATYKEILGVPHASEQRYDAEFFKTFRRQNIVLSARIYARESNVAALEILFTYHGSDLLPHRLAILSNFPETTSPHQYSALLPEACHHGGSLVIIPWRERKHRAADWCEEAECRMVVEPSPQDGSEFLYATQPELLPFRTPQLAVEEVMDWYRSRAEEIEHHAGQVDCALSLTRLGMERQIPGLLDLCDDLVTLETLVYEAGCDLTLTLAELQKMKDIEKLRLLMNSCSEDKYVTSAYQWMVPFLHRCEKHSPGVAKELLREYLVTLAKGDLRLPLKIFQHSKPDLQQRIIPDQDQLMVTALECIYSCVRSDQLPLCYGILECLPQRGCGQKTQVTSALHDRVDQLQRILSVSEILEKHGIEKPISFVKDTQASAEEARKLMVRLTRHTGRKQPPVGESHWRALLQDMLTVQQSVYTCLDPSACHEIFTESLLCSSRLENVQLAGQLMHSGLANPPASAAQKGRLQYRVGYEKSVELVLAASREYFNSSTSLADSCMDLARCCLQLIADRPTAIQEELDLIQALGCLEEFGVKILPLQVRLCTDRISLIKECISRSPTCYKQSAKLLGLAELLRVADEDLEERRGQVLILLVEQALRLHDYKAANVHCQELMATGYPQSWDVCSQLGQSEAYQDLATRQELMAFALTHCPPGSIEPLLAASSSLEAEILYQRVNSQIHLEGGESVGVSPLIGKVPPEAEPGFPGSGSADLLSWTTAATMKVLSNTTTTTRAVLQAVSDRQWWKKSLTYLRPLQGQEFGGSHQDGAVASEDLQKQGCHPFDGSVISNPFVPESGVTCDPCQPVPVESLAELLLRTGKLAEAGTEGQAVLPTTEVLLQLASDALPGDVTLALAYLLSLPQVLDANRCFEKQSHSALSLQLAVYYYSLQIYARLAPCSRDNCHPVYRAHPKEVIRMVTSYVTRRGQEAWPEDLASLTAHLHYYNEKLLDFTQAQLLQGLGKGVDVQRFTADDQYKRETILGLAETLEENILGIALSLAQRYGVSCWAVFMTHLEFLFTDSGLSTAEIETRAQAQLFETLKTDPEAFHRHMAKYIYPSISGLDHERLLCYFTLLDSCGCADFGDPVMKPKTHIQLLKKFKVIAAGLNYKKLTDGSTNPLEALEPVLSSQNILPISKLAPRIPKKDRGMLSASSLYTLWLQKLFWTGDPHRLKQVPASPPEWLRAFDACVKYFDRLHPGDLITVLDALTFSAEAVTKLSVEVREEMTRKATATVTHLMEKSRKRNSEDDIQEASTSAVTYADALGHLQKSLAHLGTLGHSFVLSLKNSEQEALRRYSDLYDRSRSEKEPLHHLAVTMCLEGQPLGTIRQLLEVAVGPQDLSPKDVMRSAIVRIISVLSGGSADLGGTGDPLRVLEGMIAAVHASVDSGEKCVTSACVCVTLWSLCGSRALCMLTSALPLSYILEQSFRLTEEDSRLLVFFRTEAILKAAWPGRQVDVADVASEEQRCALFSELLDSSHREAEFQHLALLLHAWPPMRSEHAAGATRNPWLRLAAAMLRRWPAQSEENVGDTVLRMCRSVHHTEQMLPAEAMKELCLLLRDRALLLPSLKLMLERPEPELRALVLEQVAAITQVDDSNCDPELLSLLLDAGLLVPCIPTRFYPHLIRHLLAEQGRWDEEQLAAQLRAAGHEAEAGSLLLAVRGTHRALRTFRAALGTGQ